MPEYDKIHQIDINALARTDLGTGLRFNDTVPSIQKIAESLLFFRNKDSTLTDVEKESILAVSTEFFGIVDLIQKFQVDSAENYEQTKNRRAQIIKRVQALHKLSIQSLLPLITYIKIADTQIDQRLKDIVENTQSKLSQIDKQFTTQIQNFENNANTRIKEVDNQINAARRELSEVEKIKIEASNFSVEKLVEKYGDVFSKQARKNLYMAIASLIIFVLSVAGLLFFTYKLFTPLLAQITEGDFSNGYTIVNSIYRLTLILIASIFVKESIKSFNANMHLYNLNLHRQNALLSFDTLVKNAREHGESRDKIIQEVAQTIYSNQDNGYLSSRKKAINTSEMIELFKTLRG